MPLGKNHEICVITIFFIGIFGKYGVFYRVFRSDSGIRAFFNIWNWIQVTDNEALRQLLEPPVLAEREHFLIKLAENPAEIEAAQRLRYRVFMAEQGHMDGGAPDDAPDDGLDVDEFDQYCLHLIIVDRKRREIVGTYRVHPGVVAAHGIGFYSEREYRISGLAEIAPCLIELGRSCVSPDFRNGAVVALLWAGMAVLQRRSQCRYLLGCVSLETVDPAIGWALYHHFQTQEALFTPAISALPQAGFELPEVGDAAVEEYLTGAKRHELSSWMPPLLKGYLRLGAKLAGVPVLDREFGAIDFLVLFDFNEINQKYARHFL